MVKFSSTLVFDIVDGKAVVIYVRVQRKGLNNEVLCETPPKKGGVRCN